MEREPCTYHPGNHETNILKRLETDPTQRLVGDLRRRGSPVEAGGYQGYTRLEFKAKTWSKSLLVKHHHGHGGGGVVTKGTLWPQRRAAWWPDADIVVGGHIHESWLFPVERERVMPNGSIIQDRQLHLTTPGYKRETTAGDGWAVERGMPPKPQGAWWVRFYHERVDGSDVIRYEAMEAA